MNKGANESLYMQLEIGHNVQRPMQSEVCLWGTRQSAMICNAMHELMFRQLVYDASDILVRFPNPLVLPRASESENLTTVSMITGLD